MCLQVYMVQYMVHHAMVHRPMFEPGEMLCMGRAGPGYLAPGPAPAQFWVEGHLVDTGTGTTLHCTGTLAHWIQGTVTSHPAASSSRDSVREAAVTRDRYSCRGAE